MTFLARMAEASRARAREARARESEAALERRALATPAAPPLSLDRFDVIAELKLRSPSAGGLANEGFDARAQLACYSRGGAAAVSVLTEPTAFRGELTHLAEAARSLEGRQPVMRKDFLTEPYQVLEARAAGAGGVLVILAMLDDATVRELVACARAAGMFVLLEAFDRADLERLEPYDAPQPAAARILAGVNCRDLRDLEVRFDRFGELGPHLPRHLPAVAESGIGTPADVEAVVAAGFDLALVGSALMRAGDPEAALAGLIAAGRAAAARRPPRCS